MAKADLAMVRCDSASNSSGSFSLLIRCSCIVNAGLVQCKLEITSHLSGDCSYDIFFVLGIFFKITVIVNSGSIIFIRVAYLSSIQQ